MAKPAAAVEAKQATQSLKMKAPKKGSVLFESGETDGLFQAVYLMRSGAAKHLGIPEADLDKVKSIEVTVKAVM